MPPVLETRTRTTPPPGVAAPGNHRSGPASRRDPGHLLPTRRVPDASLALAGRAAARPGPSAPTRGGSPAMPKAPAGTLYRGREGMWSWVAHRVTGVLIFFFLFAHVLDTALVRVSPDSYNRVIDTYKTPFVNLMEVGLVGAVLYHALNGIRVMLIDFWDKGVRYQREMTWVIVTLFVVVMVPGAFFMLKHTFESVFGSASGRGCSRASRTHRSSRRRGPAASGPPVSGRRPT